MDISDYGKVFDETVRLFDAEQYKGVIELADRALKRSEFRNDPITAHLLYARKAESQSELSKYQYAIGNARRAVSLCPTCPFGNSVLLTALESYAQKHRDAAAMKEAIALAQRIIKRGVDSILADPCMKKKKSVAIAFVADAWFLLGHLYVLKGDKRKVARALEMFLNVSRKGRYTDFTAEEAVETLASLKK